MTLSSRLTAISQYIIRSLSCSAFSRSNSVASATPPASEQGPGCMLTQPGMQAMAAEIQAAGGVVTADDLTRNQPVIRQPLRAKVSPGQPDQHKWLLLEGFAMRVQGWHAWALP